jgi:glucose/mannose-6-phosphate isomerase
MSILKHPDQWAAIDSKSMSLLLEAFPEQIQAAAKAGRNISVEKAGEIRSLIVTGIGGSAIGGDLVRSIAGPQLHVPLLVNRDYDLPGFADARSMVFVCSYSGNTEETLSAYLQACRAKSSIVCITSGGKLGEMAKSDGYPLVLLPAACLRARPWGIRCSVSFLRCRR